MSNETYLNAALFPKIRFGLSCESQFAKRSKPIQMYSYPGQQTENHGTNTASAAITSQYMEQQRMSVPHELTTGMLFVLVKSARDLKSTQLMGKQSPYCKLVVAGRKSKTEPDKGGGRNPE